MYKADKEEEARLARMSAMYWKKRTAVPQIDSPALDEANTAAVEYRDGLPNSENQEAYLWRLNRAFFHTARGIELTDKALQVWLDEADEGTPSGQVKKARKALELQVDA